MSLSILDIKDEFQALEKMVAEKKVKSEIVTSAKKQLYEHLELKHREYTADIAKIGKEVFRKMEETNQYVKNMKEVNQLFQKEVEYEAKKAQNEAAALLGKPLPFSPNHMNKLEQEIIERKKRLKPILVDKIDIEPIATQKGRLEWLITAIDNIKNLQLIIEESNKRDRKKLYFYKLLQIVSFVLSVYGVFKIVDFLKPILPIYEIFLNLIAGVIVLLLIDRITNNWKESLYWKNLENTIKDYAKVINEMKTVDNELSNYRF